ncbi:hypothetical protein ACOCJ5_15990 [Knoellia sp. CPCC 206450]|uniref:hypothetical protein n=1 Tax=Knoellia tibetensis TaxID=3404798 RepID=UPI003B4337FD
MSPPSLTTGMPCGASRARRAAVAVVTALALPLVVACDRSAPAPAATPTAARPTGPETPTAAPGGLPTLTASPPAGGEPSSPLPDARTVRGRASSVTGTVDEATLTAYAAMADRAVAEVSKRWTRTWPRRVSVVAPKDATQFREQVGRADDLSQVAAITDGPIGPDGRATGDRIVLNPDAFARLTPEGRQFVLTHESTHVAVRASLAGAAPLWLVEGYADHVGYSASDRRVTELAAPLLEKVAQGAGPTRLPTQGDLDPSRGEIAPGYLASWLAVDLIARRHGEATLRRFYEASAVEGSPAQADAAMDRAFVDVLGTTRAEFSRAWLSDLNRLAAPK